MPARFTAALLAATLTVSATTAGEPEAIKALEAVGAKVPLNRNKKPDGHADLSSDRVKDEHLKLLAEFKSLPLVIIGGDAQVTPDGVKQLAQVKGLLRVAFRGKNQGDPQAKAVSTVVGLEEITFESGELTDDGVKSLAALSKLKMLNVKWSKKVEGKTLAEFKKIKPLEVLVVSGTAVTGETLGELAALPNLVSVVANFAPLGDAGMKEVAKLTKLKRLELSRTAITDKGLAELKGLEGLEELEIAGTKAGDASIPLLAGMKGLRQLAVSKDQFTKLDELKKAMPKCNVRVITPLEGW